MGSSHLGHPGALGAGVSFEVARGSQVEPAPVGTRERPVGHAADEVL